MSSKSFEELEEEFLDRWLEANGFPTIVPYQMKILTYLGHISVEQEKLKNLMKKNKGGQFKKFSDAARRASIFLSAKDSLIKQGHENPNIKVVLEYCIEISKILHSLGEISEEECRLWTKPSFETLQKTIRKGLKEYEEILQSE